MRPRRVVPALIALFVAALAARRRQASRAAGRRLRQAPAQTGALAAPPRALTSHSTSDDVLDGEIVDELTDGGAPTGEEIAPAELADAGTAGARANGHWADEPAPTPAELAELETATPPAPHFVSVPWTLAIDETAAGDRSELPIGYTLLGDRMELDRIDVRETASQVFVTVLARWRPPETAWAPFGVAREATLRLERPLGDRALVHAPDQLDELRRA